MRRANAVIGSTIFFVLAPCVVAGLVPWWISHWQVQPTTLNLEALRIAGGVLAVAGAIVLIDSFARFALQGLGTPAPIAPTRHLVVTGLYRYVRNPMYVGVVAAILGQALLFADTRLLIYAAVVWLAFHLFVVAYEEPTLQEAFGEEYAAFKKNVPRWLPRLTPWQAAVGGKPKS